MITLCTVYIHFVQCGVVFILVISLAQSTLHAASTGCCTTAVKCVNVTRFSTTSFLPLLSSVYSIHCMQDEIDLSVMHLQYSLKFTVV